MRENTDLNTFLHRACEMGAVEAKAIDPASIVTAAWVRYKCQFGCGGYNSSLCCPPHSPRPEQTREVIDCYNRAILIHCKQNGDPKKIARELEREIFLSGYYKALGLGDGPCRLCDKCNMERCIHPRDARPSLEACGIDVYATARGNGFPIEVVKDRTCDQNYYGVILVD
jgi:predicted metal-binding protein